MKRTLFLALALVAMAGAAQADILAAATRQTFTTPVTTSAVNLPLDDAGATSLVFTTPVAQTVAITYSTDCKVNTAGSALAVIIYVDGVAANGTAALSAGSQLCMTADVAAHSRTAWINVPAGNHTLQITGQILGAGTAGTLRRTTTVVQN